MPMAEEGRTDRPLTTGMPQIAVFLSEFTINHKSSEDLIFRLDSFVFNVPRKTEMGMGCFCKENDAVFNAFQISSYQQYIFP